MLTYRSHRRFGLMRDGGFGSITQNLACRQGLTSIMKRFSVATLACLLAFAASTASAADWAVKMFDATSHDFGTVARGADTEYRFRFRNPFVEEVHVTSVTSSCGCTSPRVENATLSTFQESEVIARFNTDSHQGFKSATVTVTFDKPYYAQVQLRVSGEIRSDVTVRPGRIDFGSVERGKPAERTVRVESYLSNWRIASVKTAHPHLKVEARPVAGSGSRGVYDLVAVLAPDAPVGPINDQVIVVAGDREIPISVAGEVASEVVVTPRSLYLGELNPGEVIEKKIIVRAKRDFRLTNAACCEQFELDLGEEPGVRHLVTVRYTAPAQPGRISEDIKLSTDLGESVVSLLHAHGQVVKEDR